MRRFFRFQRGGSGPAPVSWLEASYWLLLGRPPDDGEMRELTRLLDLGNPRSEILLRLLSSPEFRFRYQNIIDRIPLPDGGVVLEQNLRKMGDDSAFIDLCYSCLLDREADPGGRAAYANHLSLGKARHEVVVFPILRSSEFANRFKGLCPAGGVVPQDVQLCELANPAKWDNREWISVLDELQLPASNKLAMHRKAYEFTQTAWGLSRLGVLNDRAGVLSVGAGHEPLAYWLANKAGMVIGVDLYQGEWQASGAAEGDLRVVKSPHEFAPFPYRRERLRFLQMDGRRLAFRDGSFDVAYSLSSIEHFGDWNGARESVEGMARVVRPGGIVVIATEWQISGPPRGEIFQPEAFRSLIDIPGLDLIEPLDDRVWKRYSAAVVDLLRNPHEAPHMLVQMEGTVFTSVLVFLRRRS